MGCLEGSGLPVLYIGRTAPKVNSDVKGLTIYTTKFNIQEICVVFGKGITRWSQWPCYLRQAVLYRTNTKASGFNFTVVVMNIYVSRCDVTLSFRSLYHSMSNETKINELEKMWNKFSDLIADNTPEFS
jgi:hypothetical protein